VREVFEIPLAKGSGVAVVADKYWPAKQARSRLKIEWDFSGVERADTAELTARYKQLSLTPGMVAFSSGDAKALDQVAARNRFTAEFEFPFLAHSPMEPLNTTVRFDGDRAEVWAGSQFQTVDQAAVGEVLGLKPEQVTFHTEMAGGGFGRRAVADSHVQREAALIAKRLRGTPVKLVWSREDDVQGGYYRPTNWFAGRLAARNSRPVDNGRHSVCRLHDKERRGFDDDRRRGGHALQHSKPARFGAPHEGECPRALVAVRRTYAYCVCDGDFDRRTRDARANGSDRLSTQVTEAGSEEVVELTRAAR
jgi:CO/xanthine dehydrogenase Mo-binding subunit